MDHIALPIIEIYRKFGYIKYGEKMSVLSHSFQAALLAEERGCNEELILAAFLHDIGHLIPMEEEIKHREMDGFGIVNHEEIGAEYLRKIGFGDAICCPIANHVKSKQYLCATNEEYFQELSEASINTLKFQGGPMKIDEIANFEKDPYYEDSIALRLLDDEAKKEDYRIKPSKLDEYFFRIDQYLNKQ